MVNEVVLNYIRSNEGKFAMEDIRKKISSRGYSKNEIDEAVRVLNTVPKKSSPKVVASKKVEVPKKVVVPKKKVKVREPVSVKKGGFKWVKMAGIIGFVFFVLMFLNFVLGLFNVGILPSGPEAWVEYLNLGLLFVATVAFCFYYFGFVKLGKFAGSKILKVSSIVFMVFSVLLLLLFVASSVFSLFTVPNVDPFVPTGSVNGDSNFMGYVFLGLFFAMIVFRYLFVIGLIRIRKKVKFALVAGIFGLIGIVIVTLIVGIFVYLIINPEGFVSLISTIGESFLIVIKWSGYVLNVLVIGVLLFEGLALLNGSKKFE